VVATSAVVVCAEVSETTVVAATAEVSATTVVPPIEVVPCEGGLGEATRLVQPAKKNRRSVRRSDPAKVMTTGSEPSNSKPTEKLFSSSVSSKALKGSVSGTGKETGFSNVAPLENSSTWIMVSLLR